MVYLHSKSNIDSLALQETNVQDIENALWTCNDKVHEAISLVFRLVEDIGRSICETSFIIGFLLLDLYLNLTIKHGKICMHCLGKTMTY